MVKSSGASPRCFSLSTKVQSLSSPFGKTICNLAFSTQFSSSSTDFGWLQKLKLRPREKFFWRRLALDAIPTCSWLARRGLSAERDCPWGFREVESRNHLLGDCATLQVVARTVLRWGLRLPLAYSWDEFIARLSRASKGDIGPFQFLSCAVYQCWRACNARVHGQEHATTTVMETHILTSFSTSPAYPS
ncbi:hypothetical protein KSP40_PGU016222 [Platanthera guangdongensis]|uniref:Reverse transcriptase zinc-binding domain-containing protein n=1 Tax=Platanthera guangdongensis TaxID=2320717 RepID=A0ABR2MV58_9ASPA